MCFFICCKLECTEWLHSWLSICFPLTLSTIYAAFWLHIVAFLVLQGATYTGLSNHPRDVQFNKNFMAKDLEFDLVVQNHSNLTTSNLELDHLIKSWNGMFLNQYARGMYKSLFVLGCFVASVMDLLLIIAIVPILIRNSCGKTTPDHFHQNDWKCFKNKLGIGLTSLIALVAIFLTTVVIMEIVDIMDTEMIYEESFPYCMRGNTLLQRFCILARGEVKTNDDWCDELQISFNNSYLCAEFSEKIKPAVLGVAGAIAHLVLIYTYARLALRSWVFARFRERNKEHTELKAKRKAQRKALAAKAPVKLKLAQDLKKVHLAERSMMEKELEEALQRMKLEIRIKNVRRRMARRATRKEKKAKKDVKSTSDLEAKK